MDEFAQAVISSGGRIGKGCSFQVDRFKVGRGIVIEDDVRIRCTSLELGDDIKIERGSDINVTKELSLGRQSILGPNFRLHGRSVKIGRELWSGMNATIGGGSCFEVHSRLTMGYWCHLGDYSFVNTAREVTVGNEVGMGVRTCIFTHGAYQSYLDGFPVQFAPVRIGDRCWLPNAIVNPGVTIGEGTVVAAGSIVTKDLPPGCLAAGMPAKVLKENAYPKMASDEEARDRLFEILTVFYDFLLEGDGRFDLDIKSKGILGHSTYIGLDASVRKERTVVLALDDAAPLARDGQTVFRPRARSVTGPADGTSERLRNLLRRYGIRFKVDVEDGRYVPWRGDE